mgnify:CR=1 FL=1
MHQHLKLGPLVLILVPLLPGYTIREALGVSHCTGFPLFIPLRSLLILTRDQCYQRGAARGFCSCLRSLTPGSRAIFSCVLFIQVVLCRLTLVPLLPGYHSWSNRGFTPHRVSIVHSIKISLDPKSWSMLPARCRTWISLVPEEFIPRCQSNLFMRWEFGIIPLPFI